MEADILDVLDQIGYEGPLLENEALLQAAEAGLKSADYVNLCTWIVFRLKPLCDLEEVLSSSPEDSDSLQFEISGLLKELNCPYHSLVSGILQRGLQNKKDSLKLLLFLSSELQAAQIVSSRLTKDKEPVDAGSPALKDLQAICETLNIPEPRDPDTSALFSQIESKVNTVLLKLPRGHIDEPAMKTSISSEQWERLKDINKVLASEYECRRRMLIKRLDVTVQSFGWSERAKVRVDSMARAYQPRRHSLALLPSVGMAELLAARQDICHVVKTSSGSSRQGTACAVNKILMGRVPDRGGRPSEMNAPLPEMPAWQKRQDGGGGWGRQGGGGGGGGWGGGGGGGGGWNHGGHGGKRGRYNY